MDIRLAHFEQFLKVNSAVVLVSVVEVKGSTPRNIDAFMLVSEGQIIGTIGGGNLEFVAIENAKKMLVRGEKTKQLEIALGVKNKQCCGGFVKLGLEVLDRKLSDNLLKELRQQEKNLPYIYLFGAGHVGSALANLLAQMPYKTILVDTRQDVAIDVPNIIKTIITPLPEQIVREAKANSAFVIFTHDHEIDFLILSEILNRSDAKYVGMIGSITKRKKFENWYIKNGGNEENLTGLICPIGGGVGVGSATTNGDRNNGGGVGVGSATTNGDKNNGGGAGASLRGASAREESLRGASAREESLRGASAQETCATSNGDKNNKYLRELLGDKRPTIIAALTLGEIISRLSNSEVEGL